MTFLHGCLLLSLPGVVYNDDGGSEPPHLYSGIPLFGGGPASDPRFKLLVKLVLLALWLLELPIPSCRRSEVVGALTGVLIGCEPPSRPLLLPEDGLPVCTSGFLVCFDGPDDISSLLTFLTLLVLAPLTLLLLAYKLVLL